MKDLRVPRISQKTRRTWVLKVKPIELTHGGNHLLLHFYMVYIYKYVKKKVETSPGYKVNIHIDEWRDFVQGPMEN